MTYTSLSEDEINKLFSDMCVGVNLTQPIIELLRWSTIVNKPHTYDPHIYDLRPNYKYFAQQIYVGPYFVTTLPPRSFRDGKGETTLHYRKIEYGCLNDEALMFKKRYDFHNTRQDYLITTIINILWIDILLTKDKTQMTQKMQNIQLMYCNNFALFYNKCCKLTQLVIYNKLLDKLDIIQRLKYVEETKLSLLIKGIVYDGLCVQFRLFDNDRSYYSYIINDIVKYHLYDFYRIMKHVLINDILIRVFDTFYDVYHDYVLLIFVSWYDAIPWKDTKSMNHINL